jgi:hypothetical protein
MDPSILTLKVSPLAALQTKIALPTLFDSNDIEVRVEHRFYLL